MGVVTADIIVAAATTVGERTKVATGSERPNKRRNYTRKEVMAKEQSQIKERQRTNLKEPRRYKVIIYNDDFTTMEFVVMILKQIFLKSECTTPTRRWLAFTATILLCRRPTRPPAWPVKPAIRCG